MLYIFWSLRYWSTSSDQENRYEDQLLRSLLKPKTIREQEVLNSFKIADKVNSKAVYGKDVRQVLNYVATGNVDAGIVYRTDAQVSDNVQIVATAPENTHSPVIYPIAVIKDSDNPEAANELIEFLSTPEAQAIFEEYGFVSVISDQ